MQYACHPAVLRMAPQGSGVRDLRGCSRHLDPPQIRDSCLQQGGHDMRQSSGRNVAITLLVSLAVSCGIYARPAFAQCLVENAAVMDSGVVAELSPGSALDSNRGVV